MPAPLLEVEVPETLTVDSTLASCANRTIFISCIATPRVCATPRRRETEGGQAHKSACGQAGHQAGACRLLSGAPGYGWCCFAHRLTLQVSRTLAARVEAVGTMPPRSNRPVA